MLTLLLLLLLGAAWSCGCRAVGDADELLQVSLLFRHGDRSAMRPLPLDPHASALERVGRAQLLERGVRQLFQLGTWLRGRYGNRLPRRFNVSSMRVRSTDTDRTLMSAQALLAGLFPDQCRGGGSALPACYPVPVHSMPTEVDQLLKMSSPCAAFDRRWRQFRARPGGPFAAAGREFGWLARLARERTGWPRAGACQVGQLWKVGDTVSSWLRMGLAVPAWANESVLAGLNELKRRKFVWMFEEPGLHSARVGLLVATLLGDMRLRLRGHSDKQVQLYSTHDSTVAALLHAFQVFNGLQPPMAACVMAELRPGGEFRLLYRNSSELPAHPLDIPFCPAPCLLPDLEAEMRRRGVWAESAQAMCGGGDSAIGAQPPEPLGAPCGCLLAALLATACALLLS